MSTFSGDIFLPDAVIDKHKKYSLRDRHHKRNCNRIDRERTGRTTQKDENKEERARSGVEKEELIKDLSLLSSTFSDNSTFNCVQNAQNILEFNRVASVDVIRIQNSLQNETSPTNTFKMTSIGSLFLKKEEKATVQTPRIANLNDTNHEAFSSRQFGQSDGWKFKNLAALEIPIEDNRGKAAKIKYSLRRSNPLSSTRSELRVCLCYSDLRFPLRSLKGQELSEMLQSQKTFQRRQGDNKFSRFLCNQFGKMGRYGCRCQPKCHWINRWLNRAQYQEFKGCEPIPAKDWETAVSQIEKDIPRTQVNSETFLQEDYRQRLREVLTNYCKIDWEAGYVQGMNVVASVIVYHSASAFEALKVLELLMKQMNLRQIYTSDLSFGSKVASCLVSELKRLAFDLYSHLSAQGVDIKLFAISWYLSLLGAFIPLEWMHGTIEKFMRRGWSGINEIILALLLFFKEDILIRDTTEIMELLSCRELQARAQQIDWCQLITRSDNILLPLVAL